MLQCEPTDQFGIVQMGGVGMDTAEFSAHVTKDIINTQFDACNAYAKYGSDYSPEANAFAFHKFIEVSGLKNIVVFAHSFGGIATVDMLDEYYKKYPESDVNTSIAFFSSPVGGEDLSPISWGTAQIVSLSEAPKLLVYLFTLGGSVVQGQNSVLNEQTWADADANTEANPPRLLQQTTSRLLRGGMRPIASEARPALAKRQPTLIYIAVDGDLTVKDQAPESIEARLGRKMDKIINLPCEDSKLGCHADLWFSQFAERYRNAITNTIQTASMKNDFRVRKPFIPTNERGGQGGVQRPV